MLQEILKSTRVRLSTSDFFLNEISIVNQSAEKILPGFQTGFSSPGSKAKIAQSLL